MFPVPVFVGSCQFVSVFCVHCFSYKYNQDTTEAILLSSLPNKYINEMK